MALSKLKGDVKNVWFKHIKEKQHVLLPNAKLPGKPFGWGDAMSFSTP